MTDIVTITPSPAIDLSTAVDRIVPVAKLRGRSQRRDPGGGGINVARVIRRLGGDARAIYPVGGAIGKLLRQLLTAAADRRILLEVRTDNQVAIGLYESEGFVRLGVRRRYYQPSGADAYTMARPR